MNEWEKKAKVELQPVLVYSTKDKIGQFNRTSLRTGLNNAEKYGRAYEKLSKEDQKIFLLTKRL